MSSAYGNRGQNYAPQDYVLDRNQRVASDARETVREWEKLGTSMEGVHKGFLSLKQQVEATDKIFTAAASKFRGRWDFLGAPAAAAKFIADSQHFSQSFNRTFSGLQGHLSLLNLESTKAVKHLHNLGKDSLEYFGKAADLRGNINKLVSEEDLLTKAIVEARGSGNKLLTDELLTQKDILSKARVVLTTEKAIGEAKMATAASGAVLLATIGQTSIIASKLQTTFKNVGLSFTESMGTVGKLIDAVGASKGLATIEQATEALQALRSQGLSYFNDQKLLNSVVRLSTATGMSAQSVADIAREMHTLGGDTQGFERLSNIMTYFSQQSELTADEVSHIVKSAEPLIADFPRKMQNETVKSILAVASAFKHLGLNTEAALSDMDEMQNILSSEGIKKAAMVAGFGGGNAGAIISGQMSPADMAKLQIRAAFNAMQQRGGMSISSASALYSQMGVGNREDLKKAAQWTPEEERAAEEEIDAKQREAEATDNINKALNKLLSGPYHAFQATINMLEMALLKIGQGGLEALGHFFEGIGWLGSQIYNAPAIKSTIDGIGWFLQQISSPLLKNAALVVIPAAFTYLFKGVNILSSGMLSLIRVFDKGKQEAQNFEMGIVNTIKSLKEETVAQQALAESCILATTAKEKETAAQKSSATTQMEMNFGGGNTKTKGVNEHPGSGMVTAATAATVAAGAGLGPMEKMIESEAKKSWWKGGGISPLMSGAGSSILKGAGNKIFGAAKGVLGWAGKIGGAVSGKIPIIGSLIGAAMGVGSLIGRVQTGDGGAGNITNWIQGIIDVIAGILGGLGPIGIIASLALTTINSVWDWITGKNKDDEEARKKKQADDEAHRIKSLGTNYGTLDSANRSTPALVGGDSGVSGIGALSGSNNGRTTGLNAAGGTSGAFEGGIQGKTGGENLNAPLNTGKASPGGKAIYQKLLSAYQSSGLVGKVPADGARWGITTGSAKEWATFATAVCAQESDFNPRSTNLNDPGGSFGIFQYNKQQVPGAGPYDVDASIARFVSDSKDSMSAGGIESHSGNIWKLFGSIRRPNEALSRMPEARAIAGLTTSTNQTASNTNTNQTINQEASQTKKSNIPTPTTPTASNTNTNQTINQEASKAKASNIPTTTTDSNAINQDASKAKPANTPTPATDVKTTTPTDGPKVKTSRYETFGQNSDDTHLKKLTASTLDFHRRHKESFEQNRLRRFNDRTLLPLADEEVLS